MPVTVVAISVCVQSKKQNPAELSIISQPAGDQLMWQNQPQSHHFPARAGKGDHKSTNHADADRSLEGEVTLPLMSLAQKFVFAVDAQGWN